jgi:hypothetical protein
MLLVENIGLYLLFKGTLNTVYGILTMFLVRSKFLMVVSGTQRHLVDTATGASSLETLFCAYHLR